MNTESNLVTVSISSGVGSRVEKTAIAVNLNELRFVGANGELVFKDTSVRMIPVGLAMKLIELIGERPKVSYCHLGVDDVVAEAKKRIEEDSEIQRRNVTELVRRHNNRKGVPGEIARIITRTIKKKRSKSKQAAARQGPRNADDVE